MASSRKYLFQDEIQQSLLQDITDSDQSNFSDESDSSGTDDLTLDEEIVAETDSDDECNEIKFGTASSAPSASSDKFTWEDMTNYVGQREQFVDNCGPQNEAQSEIDGAKVFKMFFDEELMELIVRETNTYAAQKIQARSFIPLRSTMRDWKPVTTDEIYVVLAIFMLMGIIQKPTLRSYFSKHVILATPIFGSIISRDRFESICNFMHFNNNCNIGTYQGPSKLFKIYPVLSHFNTKFQSLYLPGQNIAIDESLTLWRGRLSFRQYIPLKSSKFGIKSYELCESSSGYLWSFIIYTGKGTVFQTSFLSGDTNKTAAIVLSLVEPLLKKGRTLWMDNFYNSPALAQKLKSLKTDCVGTLRLSRKDVPQRVKDKKLRKGELVAQHSGPVSVLKWKDKKEVAMISTYHGQETRMKLTKCKQEKQKPVSVLDYNENMGGVDLKDQLLQPYLLERKKMTKWYIKLFRRLLNTTILNCMVICRANSGQTKIDHLRFRVELVQALLTEHGSETVRKFQGHHSSDKNVLRLVERHFPERIPPTEKKARPTRRCVVCYKNNRRKETVFWCPECEAALCVEECFKVFHTKLHF